MSNNFLEIGYNFLDLEEVIGAVILYESVRIFWIEAGLYCVLFIVRHRRNTAHDFIRQIYSGSEVRSGTSMYYQQN